MSSSQRRQYTFMDVYNAMRTEQRFNYVFWIEVSMQLLFENVVRKFGFVLVAIALSLIAGVAAVCFFVLLPVVASPFGLFWWWNIFFGLFLLYSLAFNYIMAVFTSPGTSADLLLQNPSLSDCDAYQAHQCKKCNIVKPQRAHHCSLCRNCVLKMDHHCPWVNNCIGQNNYRYFFCFLMFLSFSTLYISLILLPHVFGPGSLFSSARHHFPAHRQQHRMVDPPRSEASSFTPHLLLQQEEQPTLIVTKKKAAAEEEGGEEAEKLEQELGKESFAERARSLYGLLQIMITTPEDFRRQANGRKLVDAEAEEVTAQEKKILARVADLAFPVARLQQQKEKNPAEVVEEVRLPEPVVEIGRSHISHDMFRGLPSSQTSVFVVFLITSGVTLGVGALFLFHVYLVGTAHTTIEFYGKLTSSARLKREGRQYVNPYDLGSFWKNFEQVFGVGVPFYIAILPIKRPFVAPLELDQYGVARWSFVPNSV